MVECEDRMTEKESRTTRQEQGPDSEHWSGRTCHTLLVGDTECEESRLHEVENWRHPLERIQTRK